MYANYEGFDIGIDTGTPVTDEYKPSARFTGKIKKVYCKFKHQPWSVVMSSIIDVIQVQMQLDKPEIRSMEGLVGRT